jgi:hypothetical protein
MITAASSAFAQGIQLNFAALPTTDLNFTPGGFFFTSDVNGNQFDITSVNNGVGDSVGFNGYLSPNGPFVIGPITINGPVESAPVLGTSILNIVDSANVHLTGAIQWDNITTLFGIGGGLDLTGTINLTGITYAGTNHDLSTLAAEGPAVDVVSFQFIPPEPLTTLQSPPPGGLETSYSGSITATMVPEPEIVSLVGAGLGLVALARRSFQKNS